MKKVYREIILFMEADVPDELTHKEIEDYLDNTYPIVGYDESIWSITVKTIDENGTLWCDN